MRSLKKLNAAAGTTYTRWEQVVEALRREPVDKFDGTGEHAFAPVCSGNPNIT